MALIRAILALVATTILIKSEAHGEKYRGISSFAAMHKGFPCKQFLDISSHAKAPAMNVLWGTFGTSPKCVSAFTKKFEHRPHLLQIYFSNGSCRALKRCKEGEIGRTLTTNQFDQRLRKSNPKLAAQIVKRAEEILYFAVSNSNENTRLVLVVELEDRASNAAISKQITLLRQRWPYVIVRNTIRTSFGVDTRLDGLESHRLRPACGGATKYANNDGNVLSATGFAEYRSAAKGCHVVFYWFPSLQGIGANYKFVEPRKRRFWISSEDSLLAKKLLS